MKTIVIVDYGSQYTYQIAKLLRSLEGGAVRCDIIDPQQLSTTVKNSGSIAGFILSGGPRSVDALTDEEKYVIENPDIPVLGICYGMQLIAVALGGSIETAPVGEFGPMVIEWTSDDFQLHSQTSQVWMSHRDVVRKTSDCRFQVIAMSENGYPAAISNKDLNTFAVQFHPEVKHTTIGSRLLRYFVEHICKMKLGTWTEEEQLSECFRYISDSVTPDDRIILGLSGGIDSATVAGLLRRCENLNWKAVYVDHGMMRAGETDQIRRYAAEQHLPVTFIDKSSVFFESLAGVEDPEEKRKIIGKLFVDAFLEAAHDFQPTVLAQGTIYPDVVESAKSGKHQHIIKSHHNVGGLPEKLGVRLLEPLRHLFKNEVRNVARSLGLPDVLINRQPFPGPGLAIRIIGPVDRQKVSTVQKADAIWREAIQSLSTHPSQYYAGLLPGLGVAVVGDQRRHGKIIVLRAVQTDDFMTAQVFKGFDLDWLEKISTRIVNSCEDVALVMYNTTPKPPGTIEME